VRNHKISHLPKRIGDLTKLRLLRLGDNELVALPQSIGNLVELVELAAQNNRIKALPDTFTKLERLEILDVSKNLLRRLPLDFGSMTALKKVQVSGNALTSLPDSFPDLFNLEYCSVSQNRIQCLPEGFETMTQLKDFFCSLDLVEPDSRADFVDSLPKHLKDQPKYKAYHKPKPRCACLFGDKSKKKKEETAKNHRASRNSSVVRSSTVSTAEDIAIFQAVLSEGMAKQMSHKASSSREDAQETSEAKPIDQAANELAIAVNETVGKTSI